MALLQLLFFLLTGQHFGQRNFGNGIAEIPLLSLSAFFSFSLLFLLNFSNTVTEIPLPKILPVLLKKSNCGNAIAKKEKKKKFVLAIVAMPLPKMEKKNY